MAVATSGVVYHVDNMARAKHPSPKSPGQKIWAFLNSQFFITILALVFIGGAAALYKQRQDDLQDQIARRAILGKLLTEYQHRLSELSTADGRLDNQLGPSGTLNQIRRLDRSDRKATAHWDKLSDEVSSAEWDVLTGGGTYTATSPEFTGLSFLNIAGQIDHAAGIPDVQFGALRMIGILDARPPVTFLFVRAQLPSLLQWGIGRNMLYINETIPLRRGQRLTITQERQLGIPQPKPGELERLRKANDVLHAKVQNALEQAE